MPAQELSSHLFVLGESLAAFCLHCNSVKVYYFRKDQYRVSRNSVEIKALNFSQLSKISYSTPTFLAATDLTFVA